MCGNFVAYVIHKILFTFGVDKINVEQPSREHYSNIHIKLSKRNVLWMCIFGVVWMKTKII